MTDTPTPPTMTPEQRALLSGWLREPYDCTHGDDVANMADAADQLEADGETIATLTAECDAAQAEIARLTAALATIFEIASTRHIPDQPAAYAGTELEWATRQYGSLRRDILDAITKGTAT